MHFENMPLESRPAVFKTNGVDKRCESERQATRRQMLSEVTTSVIDMEKDNTAHSYGR